jgi:hypothetical protein
LRFSYRAISINRGYLWGVLMDEFNPNMAVLAMLQSAPVVSREEMLREWNGPGYHRGYLYAGDRWIAPRKSGT